MDSASAWKNLVTATIGNMGAYRTRGTKITK